MAEGQIITGAMVRQHRTRIRLCQEKFAKIIGARPGRISVWERGVTTIGPAYQRILREQFPGIDRKCK